MEKPLLLPIVRSVGAPPDVQVMPYREIAKLVTRYILEKADTFFDPRNISVANIRGDPLSAGRPKRRLNPQNTNSPLHTKRNNQLQTPPRLQTPLHTVQHGAHIII